MKKSELYTVIFVGGALFLLLLLLPFRNAGNLYDSVIRIHVLANSDSETDQAQKLMVRDSLLAYAKEHIPATSTQREAKETLEAHIPALEELARRTLLSQGSENDVKITIGEEYYPTKKYEDFSLPAGEYLSLRVKIGKAEGRNWWCVLFPPICLNSAVETEDALAGAGMDEENVSTVLSDEKSYQVRFKFLELFGKAKESLQKLF